MNYINATQVFDGLHNGLVNGLECIRERNQSRADENSLLKLLREYNELVSRHNELATRVNNLLAHQKTMETRAAAREQQWRDFTDKRHNENFKYTFELRNLLRQAGIEPPFPN